jgi:hypothetical protein
MLDSNQKVIASAIMAFPACEGRPAFKERVFLMEGFREEDLQVVVIDFKGDELHQILPKDEAWKAYLSEINARLGA